MRMNIESILNMTNYLAAAPRNFHEIAKHIALVTFAHESVQAVYVGLLEPDGSVHEVGRFGYSTLDVEAPITIPFRQSTPVRKVIKEARASIHYNTPQLVKDFPDNYRYASPPKWQSLLVIPIDDDGVVAIYFENRIEAEPSQQLNWQMIGSLISLHISRCRRSVDESFNVNHETLDHFDVAMTERQSVILKMIERGLTNAQIAQELGYSESLIRQETVQIFRKLKVSGRKEILHNPNTLPHSSNTRQSNPSTRG
jgi:DNA-binding CsgD family transcriptional regulator